MRHVSHLFFVPRPKSPDPNKIKKIREVLIRNPQGLWIREIARRAKLDKSTVSRYLAEFMNNEVEDTHPHVKGDMIKVVKLKRR